MPQILVPFVPVPVYAAPSFAPFLPVDENILKDYIRKQIEYYFR